MAKGTGIDLGTTNSCMAVIDGASPQCWKTDKRTTPSVVAFTETGYCLVGEAAKRQAVEDSQNTVFSIKRFMGRKFEEVQDEVNGFLTRLLELRTVTRMLRCRWAENARPFLLRKYRR